MKTIIVGTDFTPSGLNACKYAALLADKLNCKLTVFNLFEAPVIHSNMGLFGISYTTERRISESKTDRLIADLKKEFPKLKISQFVTSGSFKQELKHFTDHHLVEAAVMGLESKSRISKYIYGSHGVSIAGKVNAPVIIVPEKYKEHRIENTLLAVDNNEKLNKSPLLSFERFIKQSKSALNLVHVRTEDELMHPIINAIKITGKKMPIEIVKAKNLENGVKNYCKSNNIDLVALISKRHSAFYNLFAESNTKRLAFAASIPVMSLHD